MRSGRNFREVPLVNLFEPNQEPLAQEKWFYSGEQEELLNEEHSESTRVEKGKNEEPRREESETSGTALIVKVSTITPPVFLAASSNQSSQSSQSTQSTITNNSVHT
jgi:hypothetical protein